MKIVFLDIDGVLNSQSWYASAGYEAARSKFQKGDGNGRTAAELQGCHIDPEALGLLKDCVRELGLSLVLSSTWRTLPAAIEALEQAGLSFIGMTPELIEHPNARCHEIQAWLDEHGVAGDFVILDDHEEMEHLLPRWVQTYFCSGFTAREARELRARFETGDGKG